MCNTYNMNVPWQMKFIIPSCQELVWCVQLGWYNLVWWRHNESTGQIFELSFWGSLVSLPLLSQSLHQPEHPSESPRSLADGPPHPATSATLHDMRYLYIGFEDHTECSILHGLQSVMRVQLLPTWQPRSRWSSPSSLDTGDTVTGIAWAYQLLNKTSVAM